MTTTTAPPTTCPDWCTLDHARLFAEPGEHVHELTQPAAVLAVELLREGDELGGGTLLDVSTGAGESVLRLPADPMVLVRMAADLLSAAEGLSAITLEEARS